MQPERTRTFSWADPLVTAQAAGELSGLEAIRAIMDGELPGIRARLDHLEWLGVAGIWLNPTFPSPNADWGYDVADYYGVHPDLGTLEDLDALIAEARKRGIRILLDLVPNHTSDRHPWFTDRPEYYVWADRVPNNWRSIFTRGSAWRYDADRRRYYLH